MSENIVVKKDLAIIGAGLSGMAAAVFASQKYDSIAWVGETGEILFSSGLLDLLSIHPLAESKTWSNPFEGIEALALDWPAHPLARVTPETIQASFEQFTDFLAAKNVPYVMEKGKNRLMLTGLGTVRSTYMPPLTMAAGSHALENKDPALIVDIRGLKGFSARQITGALSARWPGLTAATIAFPGSQSISEAFCERMARSMDAPPTREKLAALVKPLLGQAKAVGFPPILGLYKPVEVLEDMKERLGVPVFEIPALPPSVPGIRLREAVIQGLDERGVEAFMACKVTHLEHDKGAGFTLHITGPSGPTTVHANKVILATGKFIGGGIKSDRSRVYEPLLNLPVFQPADRRSWHSLEFLDPAGHPVNQAGLEVDDMFRPLGPSGQAFDPNLFACGSVLAHQDWMRQKCGAGLALATARAVADNLPE